MKQIKKPIFSSELEQLSIELNSDRHYVPLQGSIQAGFPSPAEDFLLDRISLDERYLSKIESTFINRVKGLSMYTDYLENDILIIRSDYEAQNHDDIVVSVNASDYTLKRYDKHNQKLIALNTDYSNSIQLSEGDEVIILGVVDTLIREKKKHR